MSDIRSEISDIWGQDALNRSCGCAATAVILIFVAAVLIGYWATH